MKIEIPLTLKQSELDNSLERFDVTGYGGAKGGGKAAPLYSKVLTPFGWTTMGQLKVGSQINNPDGTLQRVIAVHPQGVIDVYEVKFIDGAKTHVGLDHLWLVRSVGKHWKAERRSYPFAESPKVEAHIMSTGDMKAALESSDRPAVLNFLVPLTEPVHYTRTCRWKREWIDPYLLGVVLGDGCIGKDSISFSSADLEIAERLRKSGVRLTDHDRKKGRCGSWGVLGLNSLFRKWGLGHCRAAEKFIPPAYLYLSVEKRIALMQGLMDTDGYVDSRGHMHFTSVSRRLAHQFQELIRGLGGKATIKSKIPGFTYKGEKKNGQRAFTVYFNSPRNAELVGLTRKKALTRAEFNGGISDLHRRITSIRYV